MIIKPRKAKLIRATMICRILKFKTKTKVWDWNLGVVGGLLKSVIRLRRKEKGGRRKGEGGRGKGS